MRITIIVGVLLIVLGIVSLVFQGIPYTSREEVVNIGPIQASTETKKRIPLPPALGGAALAGGVVLILAGLRKGGD